MRACSDGTKCNGFKLKEGQFRLDVKKKCFTQRVLKHWHWHRLPREIGDAPLLEVFKVWRRVASLPRALGLELGDL